MRNLVHPVGLGLAARGSVADVVAWAHAARERGLQTVWLHDSYFERDAVTYAAAIASQVPDIRVGLGALNPFTRHPVLVAMTVSALDEMAPGRITLGLGTGLPLRLAQMGIPYTPEGGVEGVSRAIDTLRTLWAGQRIPSATPNLMPIQPMFPPVHHVPIYIAAYRSAFLELTGQKADGYLARPCESIPGFRSIIRRIRAASVAAGRPEDAVESSGYLLTLIDESRRAALNRAKREPFVIYMMSVLSDVSLKRAGFERELRDQIMAAWRAEDYHRAASLIPDELLDAFMLCGTPADVAEAAWRYHEVGMDAPALQPVVQEEAQVRQILDAAVIYGAGQRAAAVVPPAVAARAVEAEAEPEPARAPGGIVDRQLSWGERVRRHAAAWWEIARPFSFTASITPVAVGGALAALDGAFSWPLFLLALLAAVLLHLGTNVTNEIYDVRKGIDTITSPRASHALLKGRIDEREAFALVGASFALALALGAVLIAARGWPILALGLLGAVGGYGYTAPPLEYKNRALGLPLVFLLMGPLMVLGGYYAASGMWSLQALLISIPVGLLVAAILHGNEWRDISDDARAGGSTFAMRYGRNVAHVAYVALVVGAYIVLGLGAAFGVLPAMSLLAVLSLPWLVKILRASELGASGQARAIAMIDLQTARLHMMFGLFLVLGLVLALLLGMGQ
ncbi:MAG TPA: LLM class flavin-dependent oxidoreductase [Roseiflexaceae bacterium]|nr:LLM class flavin-dependent oxidoreductase [Roseiflexaceae bacterium]